MHVQREGCESDVGKRAALESVSGKLLGAEAEVTALLLADAPRILGKLEGSSPCLVELDHQFQCLS